jgi:hypothetical protein
MIMKEARSNFHVAFSLCSKIKEISKFGNGERRMDIDTMILIAHGECPE